MIKRFLDVDLACISLAFFIPIFDILRLIFLLSPIYLIGFKIFSVSEVVKYFDSEISDDLPNANWIDKNGLFIGNHQNDMTEAIESLNLNN